MRPSSETLPPFREAPGVGRGELLSCKLVKQTQLVLRKTTLSHSAPLQDNNRQLRQSSGFASSSLFSPKLLLFFPSNSLSPLCCSETSSQFDFCDGCAEATLQDQSVLASSADSCQVHLLQITKGDFVVPEQASV